MVSVIIPTYNYGHFISNAVDSVLAQTYSNWECLIIDDGSTDNTADVIKKYLSDPRIKYIKKSNAGLAAARNTGLKAAQGDYIQFLDSDDLIENRKLELSVGYLEKHADVDLVYSDMRYFRSESPGILFYNFACDEGYDKPWMPYISGKGDIILTTLLNGNFMVASSPFFRNPGKDKHLVFDEDLKANEDWDFWLSYAAADKKFEYMNKAGTMTLIRTHASSMSRDNFVMFVSGLKTLIKRRKFNKRPELRDLYLQKVRDHLAMIRTSLLTSDSASIKKKLDFLKNSGVYQQLFRRKIDNPLLLKLYLTFFSLKLRT